MGLHEGDEDRGEIALFLHWLLPISLVALAALLALGGDGAREWLRYDRAAIGQGQYWRLLTGHLVHLGAPHFVLNAIGLALVWLLVGGGLSPARWALVILLTVAGIDLGFWLLEPGLAWYVGLSGLLHGVLAAGAVATFRRRPREATVLGALVLAKIAYEQLAGPLPGSESTTGGPVVVAAHLYGAVAGAIAAVAVLSRGRREPANR